MAFNPQTGLLEPDVPGAPVPGGIPPLTIGQPPEQTDVKSTTGASSIRHEATPEAKAAYDSQQAEFAKRQVAADKEQAAKQEQAAKDAEFAQKQAELAQQKENERLAAQKAAEVEIAKRTQIESQRRDEMEKAAHPTTYWEDKGVPARILAGFVVGLSSAAGGNAYQIYKDQESIDRQRKIDNFTRSKEFHELARNDVAAAHEALTNKLHDITNEELVNSKILDKQLAAVTKRIGTPMAQAAYEREQAQFRAGEQEKLAAQQAHYATERNSGHTDNSRTLNRNKADKSGTGPDLVIRDLDGNPIETKQGTAKARDSAAANEIDAQRAGTIEMVKNIAALRKMSQAGIGGRIAVKATGEAEGLRKDATLNYLKATVGRISESELKGADLAIPSVGTINVARDPGKVYDEFTERALSKAASSLAAKTNMPAAEADKLVRTWAAQAVTPRSGGELTQAPGATPTPPAVKTPASVGSQKVETRVLSTGRRVYRIDGGEWKVAP